MKKSAFEDFSEGVIGACYDAYDFKTCKRSDGTTYGVPSGSSCAQKGAKEVKDPSEASVRKGKSNPGRGKSDRSWAGGRSNAQAANNGRQWVKMMGKSKYTDDELQSIYGEMIGAFNDAIDHQGPAEQALKAGNYKKAAAEMSKVVQYLNESKNIENRYAHHMEANGFGSHFDKEAKEQDQSRRNINKWRNKIRSKSGQTIEGIKHGQQDRDTPGGGKKGGSGGSSGMDAAIARANADMRARGIDPEAPTHTLTQQQQAYAMQRMQQAVSEMTQAATGMSLGQMSSSMAAGNKQEYRHPDGSYRTRRHSNAPMTRHSTYEAAIAHSNRTGEVMVHPLHQGGGGMSMPQGSSTQRSW